MIAKKSLIQLLPIAVAALTTMSACVSRQETAKKPHKEELSQAENIQQALEKSVAANYPNPLSEADILVTNYQPEQNWSKEIRQGFYFVSQGSPIMPYDWAMKLERFDSRQRFFTSDSLSRYGYIPQRPSTSNPDGLPIGFTVDGYANNRQLGINCAACHTTEIKHKGFRLRIDGGPSQADFQAFVREMDQAVFATRSDQEKFKRFIGEVLGSGANSNAVSKFEMDFAAFVSKRQAWQRRNSADVAYGAGRNDAFGVIFNQVLAADLGIEENARKPNAPVSYPVLWDTNQHDFVQWVGIASNGEDSGGPIARNLGQVLGVFGHVSFDFTKRTKILGGYCTSAKRKNLEAMEAWSKQLRSPVWPKEFGEINTELARHGKSIYDNRCLKCHDRIVRDDDNRKIMARMIPISFVKTDSTVAKNAAERTARTGVLKGAKLRLVKGRPLEEVEPAALVLKHAVAGALAGTISPLTCMNVREDTGTALIAKKWGRVALASTERLFSSAESQDTGTLATRIEDQKKQVMRYKARPLNGVWASAPYLHNGAVATLYEMLLPAQERRITFALGCTDFDPIRVGLDCQTTPGAFIFDTRIEGNSNAGHEFAADLNHDERLQLLEYLKTL
jgi:hypothetical protein